MRDDELKIELNVGKGFAFNSNKLTTNSKVTDLLNKKNNGLYVPSLKGKDGLPGGSKVDGVTIIERDNNGQPPLGLNFDNVLCIFSMCAFKIGSHSLVDGVLPVTGRNINDVKNISDIVSEINYDTNGVSSTTQYFMRQNDLFMFKGLANARKCDYNSYYSEDGNRYVGSIPHALFTINNISYTGYHCDSINMTCVWVDPESVVSQVVNVGDTWNY